MILKIFSGFKIFFIAIIVLSLIPHIMAWASSKDLIGIINVSFIYLLFFIDEHRKIKRLILF